MLIKNQPQNDLFGDPSLWLLLFTNIITIFFAVKEGWNLSTVMFIYWFQSITIGFFNFIRILQLKEFSTEGFKINGRPAQPTPGTKFYTAFFFLFHYGFFHLGYLIFILAGPFGDRPFTGPYGNGLNFTEFKFIFLTALIFFINHLFSYLYNRPRDTKKQNIGSLMFYPYARIIPMHLTIILGVYFGRAILPFFLMLKMFSDIIMHIIEHKIIKRGEARETLVA